MIVVHWFAPFWGWDTSLVCLFLCFSVVCWKVKWKHDKNEVWWFSRMEQWPSTVTVWQGRLATSRKQGCWFLHCSCRTLLLACSEYCRPRVLRVCWPVAGLEVSQNHFFFYKTFFFVDFAKISKLSGRLSTCFVIVLNEKSQRMANPENLKKNCFFFSILSVRDI